MNQLNSHRAHSSVVFEVNAFVNLSQLFTRGRQQKHRLVHRKGPSFCLKWFKIYRMDLDFVCKATKSRGISFNTRYSIRYSTLLGVWTSINTINVFLVHRIRNRFCDGPKINKFTVPNNDAIRSQFTIHIVIEHSGSKPIYVSDCWNIFCDYFQLKQTSHGGTYV